MKNQNQKQKFLLADDHSIVRNGLELLVEDLDLDAEITQAASLAQLKEKLKSNEIDLLILDAQFPDGNCLPEISRIKTIYPELKILIFTSFDEETYALKFFDAGADGFLNKLSEESEIKSAILSILENGTYYSALTQKLLRQSLTNKNTVHPLHQLSEREMEIALLMVKGLGNLEIANALDLKQNTISTVKKRIFEKLKIENLVELVDLWKIHHPY